MALSYEECVDLIRHLFMSAREVDPSLHDLLGEFFEPESKPHENLERCMNALIQIVRLESRQGYSDVLGHLRDFVRDENDNAVSDIHIGLASREQDLYGTSIIRLSDLPDMAKCLEDLKLARSGIHD